MSGLIVFSLPALAVFVALGWVVDRVLGARFARAGLARWPLRFVTGIAAVFLIALHPLAALVALAPAVALRLRDRTKNSPGDPSDPPRTERVVLGAFAVLAGIAAVRAATPLYWDEFVWLAKSRVELGGWGALRTAALDPRAGVFPPGYPLLWSLAPAWLSAPWSRTPLSIATWWMQIAAVALWLWSVREALRASPSRDEGSPWSVALAALMLGATPLLVVHLRASYADLCVGLLAAAIALLSVRALSASGPLPHVLAARFVTAIVLVGLKDEGFVHLAAITFTVTAFALAASRPRVACENAAVLAMGAIPLGAWRLLLAKHGVTDVDHGFGGCAFGDAPRLVRALSMHATDITSWGVLWPLVIGTTALALARRGKAHRPAHVLVATLGSMLALTMLALTCGPDRVREFALGGSLLNRVLVQIAPLAISLAVVVATPEARGPRSLGVGADRARVARPDHDALAVLDTARDANAVLAGGEVQGDRSAPARRAVDRDLAPRKRDDSQGARARRRDG
ncbi:MAG: hypothetical protein WCJ30_12910 [Deltaproteobacteria bacterium]